MWLKWAEREKRVVECGEPMRESLRLRVARRLCDERAKLAVSMAFNPLTGKQRPELRLATNFSGFAMPCLEG